jgi:hypothetical protein
MLAQQPALAQTETTLMHVPQIEPDYPADPTQARLRGRAALQQALRPAAVACNPGSRPADEAQHPPPLVGDAPQQYAGRQLIVYCIPATQTTQKVVSYNGRHII